VVESHNQQQHATFITLSDFLPISNVGTLRLFEGLTFPLLLGKLTKQLTNFPLPFSVPTNQTKTSTSPLIGKSKGSVLDYMNQTNLEVETD